MQRQRPIMLVVLDGWGWRDAVDDNAVRQAHTPAFDRLWSQCAHAFLRTSGHDVGLPDGQMGNSEVGHLNIGAGRLVMQDLPRINKAIADGEIEKAPALQALIERLRSTKGTCHLVGLVSPGGVHSHQDHAVALASILDRAGVPSVVHALTDGRDVPPRSAGDDIARFNAALPAPASIGTVCGRYYAMDRDNRWERVSKAYATMVDAEGHTFPDADAAIRDAYAHDISDEFVLPAVIGGYRGMRDGDGVLCFNFRADRVREILAALLDPAFSGFQRKRTVQFAGAAGMTQYSTHLDQFLGTIFPPQSMANVLGEVVSRAGRTQLRMAETEKYPHVTYFLNGGNEAPYPGRGPHHGAVAQGRDLRPAAGDVGAGADGQSGGGDPQRQVRSDRAELRQPRHGRPYRHPGGGDQGGGDVDLCLGRLVEAIKSAGGALLVTADHGNCELMRDPETGGPHTAHTTNPVPVVLLGRRRVPGWRTDGWQIWHRPCSTLMQLPQPAEMTGVSLLRGEGRPKS